MKTLLSANELSVSISADRDFLGKLLPPLHRATRTGNPEKRVQVSLSGERKNLAEVYTDAGIYFFMDYLELICTCPREGPAPRSRPG